MILAPHYRRLPPELLAMQRSIEEHARSFGLDFFPTIFELVDADQLSAIAAYGGFPTRYPHWRFGMEYEQLAKGYHYGLQKIYELVINNDPCYAYLLASNEPTDHKLVMAHVYGHCDFFKNNAWFAHTNRRMIDEMANHGNRIRGYMDRFGVDEVERFIDTCLSVDDLIDVNSTAIRRADVRTRAELSAADEDSAPATSPPARFAAKSYMDPFVNPPDALAEDVERRRKAADAQPGFPAEPVRDVMLFLLEHAPLKAWQLDVLSILREEAYYFAPQGQTKIMNEGWATFWHSTIMTRRAMEAKDLICYADHCSGTLAGSAVRLNPYKLGVELFRDIEDRWNRGCFGAEYEQCEDRAALRDWNRELNDGRRKIFEVRRIHNDVTFIDEFLTLDFCRRHKFFQFSYDAEHRQYEIESREFDAVKRQLLFNLTNLGRPIIRVRDGNYKNRGELFLEHVPSGPELDLRRARDTLEALRALWRRPVHLETLVGDKPVVLSYDGFAHAPEKIP